jgi:YQGE family putative transporter
MRTRTSDWGDEQQDPPQFMNLTNRLFSVEKRDFDRLSLQAQSLIGTFFFFYLIFPIFTTFTNAFIWRQSHDIITVAMFNLGVYIALPFGYYINGHLLQKFLPSRLYSIGVLNQAAFTAAIIFSPVTNSMSVFILGALIGISAGLLWSNRNLLVLRITLNQNRIYFTSLDSTISMLLGIIIPLLMGTFIVFGQSAHLYTPLQAYYLLSLTMFLVIFFIFRRTKNIKTKLPELNEIRLKKPSKQWKKMRAFGFVFGLLSGLMGFIPIVIVLQFVGREDALGTVQSLSAVIAAIIVYFIGKKITHKQRLWIVGGSVIFSILAGMSFAIFYSKLGVFAFFAFQALSVPLGSIGFSALYFEVIEKENETKNNHYAHIFDSEIFLNSGRIIGVFIFLLAIHLFSQASAIRYTIVLLTIFQILLLIIARSIERGQKKIIFNSPQASIQVAIDPV